MPSMDGKQEIINCFWEYRNIAGIELWSNKAPQRNKIVRVIIGEQRRMAD